ncbi:MAG: hypothetical protein IPK83_00090 [Planctomycetes bacterium]|nr:hypothetical protein [Planctomycetota bacterium]
MNRRATVGLVIGLITIGSLTRPSFGQRVILVNAAATGAGDGTAWLDAFPDLPSAIDDAIPLNTPFRDQIWVKGGLYKPNSVTDSFFLESGVRVYGGFDGTESLTPISDTYDPREFDVDGQLVNVTILSGEIDSTGYFDNVEVIVTAPGDDTDFVLDGFTIEGAQKKRDHRYCVRACRQQRDISQPDRPRQ